MTLKRQTGHQTLAGTRTTTTGSHAGLTHKMVSMLIVLHERVNRHEHDFDFQKLNFIKM